VGVTYLVQEEVGKLAQTAIDLPKHMMAGRTPNIDKLAREGAICRLRSISKTSHLGHTSIETARQSVCGAEARK
jgi:2,3-bisphosphoglycerate-independent phosphoglycerate mutase